jgi:hypothetical protein
MGRKFQPFLPICTKIFSLLAFSIPDNLDLHHFKLYFYRIKTIGDMKEDESRFPFVYQEHPKC